jgi:hypothetical protein
MLQMEQSQYEVTTSVNATYMDKYWIQMGYVDVSQFVVGMVLILKVWACHMTYLFHSIVSITEWLVIRINLDFSLICNIFITLSKIRISV